MSKFEANICLIIITLFSSIQYIFTSTLSPSVSNFTFLFLTSLIGFLMLVCMFFSEFYRLDFKHIIQSLILSIVCLIYNFFLLLGSKNLSSLTISCVLSAYFAFIPIIEFILFKSKPKKNILIAILIVLVGLLFMMNLDFGSLFNVNILFLLIADISFAVYIILTGRYTVGSNPALLAMGQLFFNTLIAFICMLFEFYFKKVPINIPNDTSFWSSVIFISFFIRGMYGIIQIYAQRYVSAFNTSLIFSTEIIMTMIFSPFLVKVFYLSESNDIITLFKIIGSVVMIIGILIADENFISRFINKNE